MGTDMSMTVTGKVNLSRTASGKGVIKQIRNTGEADAALASGNKDLVALAVKSKLTSNNALICYLNERFAHSWVEGQYRGYYSDNSDKEAINNLKARVLSREEADVALSSPNLDVRMCAINSPNITNQALIDYIMGPRAGMHTSDPALKPVREAAVRVLEKRTLSEAEAVSAINNHQDSGAAGQLNIIGLGSASAPTPLLIEQAEEWCTSGRGEWQNGKMKEWKVLNSYYKESTRFMATFNNLKTRKLNKEEAVACMASLNPDIQELGLRSSFAPSDALKKYIKDEKNPEALRNAAREILKSRT